MTDEHDIDVHKSYTITSEIGEFEVYEYANGGWCIDHIDISTVTLENISTLEAVLKRAKKIIDREEAKG